jgi:hypothetical protein
MQAIIDHRKDGMLFHTQIALCIAMVNPDSRPPLPIGSSAFSGRMGLLAGRDSQI